MNINSDRQYEEEARLATFALETAEHRIAELEGQVRAWMRLKVNVQLKDENDRLRAALHGAVRIIERTNPQMTSGDMDAYNTAVVVLHTLSMGQIRGGAGDHECARQR